MVHQVRAIVLAAVVGDVAITLYLIVVAAVAGHASIGISLLRLMQWDASNGYGDAAFAGGWAMAGIGQLMDLVVSLAWAAIFTGLYLRFPAIRRNTWAWGLAFGVVVMIVMLYVLVPMGHARPMHNNAVNIVRVLIAHTAFFGLPIALVVARFVTAPLRPRRA